MSTLSLSITVSGVPETTTYNNITALKTYLNSVKAGLTEVTISGELAENSDFSYLFANSPILTTIDLTELITHDYITNLSHFLYNCPSLLSIKVSNVDGNFSTANVTDMSWAFAWNVVTKNAKQLIDNFIANSSKVTSEFYIPTDYPYYYAQAPALVKYALINTMEEYGETLSENYNQLLADLETLHPGLTGDLNLPTSLVHPEYCNIEGYITGAMGTADWIPGDPTYTGSFGRVVFYNYCDNTFKQSWAAITSAAADPLALEEYFFDDKETVLARILNLTASNISKNLIKSLTTANVTTMQGMFYGCNLLGVFDIGYTKLSLDTSQVTDMSYMLAYVPIKLLYGVGYQYFPSANSSGSISRGIDITHFDMSKVTNIDYMLEGSAIVAQSELYGVYYQGGQYVQFAAYSINFRDLGWNFIKPISAKGFMRYNLIYSLKMFHEIETPIKIINATKMFAEVNSWAVSTSGANFNSTIDFSTLAYDSTVNAGIDFSSCIGMEKMFYKLNSASSYSNTFRTTITWANLVSTSKFSGDNLDYSKVTSFKEIFKGSKNVTSTIPAIQLSTSETIDLRDMFIDQTSGAITLSNANIFANTSCIIDHAFTKAPLVCANLNLSTTSFVGSSINLEQLFYNATGLTGDIYLSLLDTSKVSSVSEIGVGCPANLHFPVNSNFENVTSLKGWGNNKVISDLHLEWFSNATITDISSIFANVWTDSTKTTRASVDSCLAALTTNINLSNVSDAATLFCGSALTAPNSFAPCSMSQINLTMPSLSNALEMFAGISFNASVSFSLDLSNVFSMMLFAYSKFSTGVAISSFPTAPQTSIKDWFNYCTFLDTNGLTPLANLVTSSCTSLQNMFNYCTFGTSGQTSSVDFTNLNWDTSNVTNFNGMFFGSTLYGGTIDLTGLDFSSATDCRQMLYTATLHEIDMGTFEADSPVNISEMFNSFNYPNAFTLSNSFNYGNITAWKDLGNTQFQALIEAHLADLISYDGVSFAGTWTYDTFVAEYVTNRQLFTVNSNHEIVIPSRVINISGMLRGSTITEGTYDFVINAPNATDVSYLFAECVCTNLIPRVVAPNAINYDYMYYRFDSSAPIKLAAAGTSEATVVTTNTLSAGTYYLYINIVDIMETAGPSENYIQLDDFVVDGQTVSFTHVKDFYYGLSNDSGTNIWRTTHKQRDHTSVFSVTLPTSGAITFTANVPSAIMACWGSKNPKLDFSGITISPNSSFENLYTPPSYPRTDTMIIEFDCHGLDLTGMQTSDETKIRGILGGHTNTYSSSDQKIAYINAANVTLPASLTSLSQAFCGCTSLIEAYFSGLEGPGITTVYSMFKNSNYIMCLDVSNWDMPVLTDVSYFCSSAINRDITKCFGTVDLSGWNTPSLTNMARMFYGCRYMGDVNFTNMYDCDTSAVTDMSYMFYGCYTLTTPNLAWIDLSSCEKIDWMFAYSILGTLDLHFFDTSHVKSADYTFYYCKATELNIKEWDLSGIKGGMTDFCSYMPNCTTINMEDFFMPTFTSVSNIFYNDTVLSTVIGPIHGEAVELALRVFDSCPAYTTFSDTLFDFPNLKCMYNILDNSGITSASFTKTYNNLEVIGYLGNGDKVTSLTFSINAPKLASLCRAFSGFTKLTTIDLSGCTFSNKLGDFYQTFYNCTLLSNISFPSFTPPVSLTISESIRGYSSYSNFDGKSNFCCTFELCKALSSINLSNVNFSNVYSAERMFYASGMTSNNFGTNTFTRLESINNVFENCTSLTAIDYTNWTMPALKTANYIFKGTTPATTTALTSFINSATSLEEASCLYGDAAATKITISGLNSSSLKRLGNEGGSYGQGFALGLVFYAPEMTELEMENCNLPNLGTFILDSNTWYSFPKLIKASFTNVTCPMVPAVYSLNLTTLSYINCKFSSAVIPMRTGSNESLVNSISVRGTDFSGASEFAWNFPKVSSIDCTGASFPDVSRMRIRGGTEISTYAHSVEEVLIGFYAPNLTLLALGAGLFEGNVELDISKITNSNNSMELRELFANNSRITAVTLKNIKIFNMYRSFTNCTSLTAVNLVNCTYSHNSNRTYTHFRETFKGCTSLVSIDLSSLSLPTPEMVYYYYPIDFVDMFAGCTNLETVDFFTNSPSRCIIGAMFKDCEKLTTINYDGVLNCYLGNFSADAFMASAFENCSLLTSIPEITFTIPTSTSRTFTSTNMFKNCAAITSLNLKWFKWAKCSNADNMFTGCSSLETIVCGAKTAPSTVYNDMFSGCASLVGNAGEPNEKRYDANDISSAFAQSATGYFTAPPISFFFNGTECSSLVFNGTEISALYWNGTKLF